MIQVMSGHMRHNEMSIYENNKALKVLCLPAWYPSEDNPVEGVFVKEQAKAVNLYDDVIVLYITQSKTAKKLYTVSDSVEEGIRTIRVKYAHSPLPYTNYLLSFLVPIFITILVSRRLIKEGFRPDVIHAHVFTAGVPAVIMGRLHKIPVIITEHYSNFIDHTLSKLEVIIAKYVMTRANLVLPVSNCLKKHIEAYGIHASFSIIPNVVNTELFTNREPGEININPKKLLTVALLRDGKGINYLLQSVKRLSLKCNDLTLDIIGDGPGRAELEALSIKEGIADIVRFHGLKDKKEVSKFMRETDIFVLPSLAESFGCVFIEAMASGVPIIATNVGAMPEIVTEDIGTLVSPMNADELADAIDYMLDHYLKYDPRSIRRYAVEKYGYETVGLQIDKLYRQSILNYKTGKR
jgi:glycosyltransferase involved in cell wall biosynthesis